MWPYEARRFDGLVQPVLLQLELEAEGCFGEAFRDGVDDLSEPDYKPITGGKAYTGVVCCSIPCSAASLKGRGGEVAECPGPEEVATVEVAPAPGGPFGRRAGESGVSRVDGEGSRCEVPVAGAGEQADEEDGAVYAGRPRGRWSQRGHFTPCQSCDGLPWPLCEIECGEEEEAEQRRSDGEREEEEDEDWHECSIRSGHGTAPNYRSLLTTSEAVHGRTQRKSELDGLDWMQLAIKPTILPCRDKFTMSHSSPLPLYTSQGPAGSSASFRQSQSVTLSRKRPAPRLRNGHTLFGGHRYSRSSSGAHPFAPLQSGSWIHLALRSPWAAFNFLRPTHLTQRARTTNLAVLLLITTCCLSLVYNVRFYFHEHPLKGERDRLPLSIRATLPQSHAVLLPAEQRNGRQELLLDASGYDTARPPSSDQGAVRSLASLDHLIVVPGHAIWKGRTAEEAYGNENWILEQVQMGGSVNTFIRHIIKG